MITDEQARAAWREYRRRNKEDVDSSGVLDMLDQWADDGTDPPDDGPITKEQADPVKHLSRYHRQFQGVTLDLYRIAKLWGVASHALFHAMKKIMMAGGRGHKDKVTDLKEAIVSIEEELKMMEEEDDRKEI